jgi:dihydroorotase
VKSFFLRKSRQVKTPTALDFIKGISLYKRGKTTNCTKAKRKLESKKPILKKRFLRGLAPKNS